MEKVRKPWLRGAVALGVLSALAAGLLVSNAGAVAENKEASKKSVKKLSSDVIHQPLYYRSATFPILDDDYEEGFVACPAGTAATGGGVAPAKEVSSEQFVDAEVEASYPSTGTGLGAGTSGWTGGMENLDDGGDETWNMRVFVICAEAQKDQSYPEGTVLTRSAGR